MRGIQIPQPPNADASGMRDNPLAFNRAVSAWMREVRGVLEGASRINDTPLGQAFVASDFTTNTAITSASTLPDVANFVASLVTALTAKGIVSPTANREA
jgi:hypothetical protein